MPSEGGGGPAASPSRAVTTPLPSHLPQEDVLSFHSHVPLVLNTSALQLEEIKDTWSVIRGILANAGFRRSPHREQPGFRAGPSLRLWTPDS